MNRSISVDNSSILRANIAPLLFSEQFSDVTFIVESSNEHIFGHKQVLASASSMFAKMLYGPFVEGSSREVKLSGVDAPVLRTLFRYIYTGNIDLSLRDIVPLMKAADQYCVNGAREDFWDAAKVIIEDGDCSEGSITQLLETMTEACEANLDDILSLCLDYVDVNTQEVMESKAFLSLHFKLCQEIVKRDTLNDGLEEVQVLLGCLRWVRGWGELNSSDPANFELPALEEDRMEQLKSLGESIRLPLIPGRDLVKFVQPLNIFSSDQMLKALSYHVAPECFEDDSSQFFRDRVGSFRAWTWSEDYIGPHMALGNDLRTVVAHHYDWEKALGSVEWHSGVHQFSCSIDMNVAGSSNSWLIIIGVVSPHSQLVGHLGSGFKEWGFACYSGIKISNSDRRDDYAKPCKSGDVITTIVDFRRKTLEFLINGVSQGVAFTNISSPLKPAVSLLRSQRVTLRFDK